MKQDARYYRVTADLYHARLPDPLTQGYESEYELRRALRRLVDRWKKREGEAIDERNGFLLLRFHDTPGGRPDEAWIPEYLLEPVDAPQYVADDEPPDELEEELDRAFGFD